MFKRFLILLLVAGVGFVTPAKAQDTVDVLAAEMATQGYDLIKVDRTLIGRTRVRGFAARTVRVVILNRKTGRVFQDKVIAIVPNAGAGRSPMEGPDFDDVTGGVTF